MLSKSIKPEKKVELEVRRWAFKHGFSLDVYDSKATYSIARKSYYRSSNLKTGTPDLVGCSQEGFAVFLELKAPGKEDVLRFEQQAFLKAKIEKNAFALVVSSVSFLEESWNTWISLREDSKDNEARDFLRDLLPNKVKIKNRIIHL